MSVTSDAAELAKAIRDELVTWPGFASGSRQRGNPYWSVIDIETDDGRTFVITVAGPPANEPVSDTGAEPEATT